MKSILLSVKPKWCAKILNGEKTVEVRKSKSLAKAIQKLINEYGYADIYVYCTKDSQHPVAPFHFKEGWFYKEYNDNTYYAQGCSAYMGDDINGQVVARFKCERMHTIKYRPDISFSYDEHPEFERATCLAYEEMRDYLSKKDGYGIYISNLEIFDTPKMLIEFKRPKWSKCEVKDKNGLYQCHKCPYGVHYSQVYYQCNYNKPIKAPQNFCYVEVEE